MQANANFQYKELLQC